MSCHLKSWFSPSLYSRMEEMATLHGRRWAMNPQDNAGNIPLLGETSNDFCSGIQSKTSILRLHLQISCQHLLLASRQNMTPPWELYIKLHCVLRTSCSPWTAEVVRWPGKELVMQDLQRPILDKRRGDTDLLFYSGHTCFTQARVQKRD